MNAALVLIAVMSDQPITRWTSVPATLLDLPRCEPSLLREIKVSPSVTQTWQNSGQEVADHNHGTHYATHHQGHERQPPERNVAGFPYPGIAENEPREYGKTKPDDLFKRKRKVSQGKDNRYSHRENYSQDYFFL